MIAHHCVGGEVDGEDFAQQCRPVHQPGLAVIEVLAGIPVVTAQESPPHAAGNAVVKVCPPAKRFRIGAGSCSACKSLGSLQVGIVKILWNARSWEISGWVSIGSFRQFTPGITDAFGFEIRNQGIFNSHGGGCVVNYRAHLYVEKIREFLTSES